MVRFNNVTLNGTAHLTNSSSIAFEGTQSLNSGTISFDDATGNVVEMQAAGTLTVGAAAAIRGNTGTIGGSRYFGAAMTLVNQGLISAEVSGETVTVSATSFTNNGTAHALNGAIALDQQCQLEQHGHDRRNELGPQSGWHVRHGGFECPTDRRDGEPDGDAEQHGSDVDPECHDRELEPGRRHDQRRHAGLCR